jgi:hypothetical protein
LRRRSLTLGLVLLAAYLVALAATVWLREDHVRPLYDGFTPPTAYRWVNAPPFFASDNIEPTATTVMIGLDSEGSAATGVATPDGQLALNFARGAVAPHGGATHVAVRITPIDPSRLAPVPSGLRPNGNAYRVDLSYRPRGGKIAALERPGSLVIEIPEVGSDLFTSGGGTRWSKLESRAVPPRELSLAATFARPGYFLGATTLPELVGPAAKSTDHAVVIGIATAALAAALFVATVVYTRRRRTR